MLMDWEVDLGEVAEVVLLPLTCTSGGALKCQRRETDG